MLFSIYQVVSKTSPLHRLVHGKSLLQCCCHCFSWHRRLLHSNSCCKTAAAASPDTVACCTATATAMRRDAVVINPASSFCCGYPSLLPVTTDWLKMKLLFIIEPMMSAELRRCFSCCRHSLPEQLLQCFLHTIHCCCHAFLFSCSFLSLSHISTNWLSFWI